MKHYRFYVRRTKSQKTLWARTAELCALRRGLVEDLRIGLRDRITVRTVNPQATVFGIEIDDSLDQALGRNGIHNYSSWGYPHLATERQDAIAFIEAHLPTWAKILKRPSEEVTKLLVGRDYENCHYSF